jgi:hypothetical protein
MKRLEELKKAEKALGEALRDRTKLETALDQWPEGDRAGYSLLDSAKWQLTFIYNDADIRSKEPEYEQAQFEKLRFIYSKIQDRIKSLEQSGKDR